jgi:hypothetical protein
LSVRAGFDHACGDDAVVQGDRLVLGRQDVAMQLRGLLGRPGHAARARHLIEVDVRLEDRPLPTAMPEIRDRARGLRVEVVIVV